MQNKIIDGIATDGSETISEKQQKILEMTKDICRMKLNCNDVCKPISACDALKYAERAVEAGYCKQSDLVQEIADFIYDGEIEGLNIEMNGRYLGKLDFIRKFAPLKKKGDKDVLKKDDSLKKYFEEIKCTDDLQDSKRKEFDKLKDEILRGKQ